jgi:hypothetical protein
MTSHQQKDLMLVARNGDVRMKVNITPKKKTLQKDPMLVTSKLGTFR